MTNDQIKLTINGRETTVRKGTTVLEAARAIGIEIPHFCYHPALSLVGSCRMCQVEFRAGGRSFLGVSCRTEVTEGMEVQTHSEPAVRARAGVLEFLLANHPLDCPICDKAGECPLQNYAYEHGFTESRFQEDRRKGHKKTPLGGHIIFDSERCILCTRCVRFMEEYAKTPQLTVAGRGDHSEITVFPGQNLDSAYTGNLADICPVGALTLEEFRFQCRVWNLKNTPSICPYCSRGCNIDLAVRSGHNALLRVTPRANPDAGGGFICNTGRFRPLEVGAEARLAEPLIGGKPAALDAALKAAAAGLAAAKGRLLVVTSVQRPTEELFLTRRIFADLAGGRIAAIQPEEEQPDGLLRTGELAANAAACNILGIPLISTDALGALLASGEIDAVFLAEPSIAFSADLARGLKCLVCHTHVAGETASAASVALPGRTWLEKQGSYINYKGRVQKFEAALAPPAPGIASDLAVLARLGRELGAPEAAKLPEAAPAVFAMLAAETPRLAGLSWSGIGEHGAQLPEEKSPKSAKRNAAEPRAAAGGEE